MLQIGMLLDGKYRILEHIGQGGMSDVYLAVNERANKKWAVKEIRQDHPLAEQLGEAALHSEIALMKELHHPNLPEIVDVLDLSDRLLVIMDYVEGHTLEWVIQELGPQQEAQVRNWGIQLCQVLGYLHAREEPIIYRDMKPSNVMVTPEGKVVLIDLGIARKYKVERQADTVCLGTFCFAAPEQYLRDTQTDTRADIYGLGATLFALLTGRPPQVGAGRKGQIRQWNPGISQGLATIIERCMEPDPELRFASCAELEYALTYTERLEEVFIRGQKKVLCRFLLLIAGTLACFVLSTRMELLGEEKQGQIYDSLLSASETYASLQQAMALIPDRWDAYAYWLQDMTEDWMLSEEEMRQIEEFRGGITVTREDGSSEVIPVLTILEREDPDMYEKLCYELGNLELFYSDALVNRDRYANASVWYAPIRDDNELADLYCRVGEALNGLEEYRGSRLPQTAKTYETYKGLWDTLNSLKEQAAKVDDPDVRFQIEDEINDMIGQDPGGFCQVVGQQPITELLTDVEQDINTDTYAVMGELQTELLLRLQTNREKIESLSEDKTVSDQ